MLSLHYDDLFLAVQEAPLNPVSPEFVPRKMQNPAEDGFEGGETNNSDWQQSKHPFESISLICS